jgi:prepilin-type processing-associated H-X9-DG protein
MKIQATTHGGRAFTLTDLFVVIGVVAVVAALLLPALVRPEHGMRITCVNNLKQIGLAFREWAGDNDDKYPMHFAMTNDAMMRLVGRGNAFLLWQTMSNELSTPRILICPDDGQHKAAINFDVGFSDANISYFFAPDVSDDSDPQLILAGDDNLAVNGKPDHSGILSLSTNDSVAWTDERHHPHMGNIALADGSVQSTTSSYLQQIFHQTGTATNRLVIP